MRPGQNSYVSKAIILSSHRSKFPPTIANSSSKSGKWIKGATPSPYNPINVLLLRLAKDQTEKRAAFLLRLFVIAFNNLLNIILAHIIPNCMFKPDACFSFGLLILSCFLLPVKLLAEGTAELMPITGDPSCISYVQGNDGKGKEGPNYGRPWYDLLYVHISDPSTEILYVGFTRKLPTSKDVYVQIIDPLGTVIYQAKVATSSKDAGYIADDGTAAYIGPSQIGGTGGYKAVEITPKEIGDYTIQFNVGHETSAQTWETKYFIHPFDVTVGDISNPSSPQAIPGRLFSYKWHLNTNSGSNKACMDFYTYTPDSMVVRMDMNGIQAHGYSVSYNSHGAQQTGDISVDRQSTTTVSVAVPEYKVFLNEPDENVYPTGTPGRVTYLNVQGCQTDSNYCIEVITTRPGELNVYIDLDGNGVYDAGGKDVYYPYATANVGTICVPWDGLDGYGSPVGDSVAGTVIVEFLAGVVHFPIWDPENHLSGFNCSIIRPSGLSSPMMYYDNSQTTIGTTDLAGCSSGCNTWSSNKGNNVMVNTWLNTITSTDADQFSITSYCAPTAINDTTCTQPGTSAQFNILGNDNASEISLDQYEVSLINADVDGDIWYNDVSQLVSFIPNGSDSGLVTLSYALCDTTQAAGFVSLCDTAAIQINKTSSCVSMAIMAPLRLKVEGQFQGGHTKLRWRLPKGPQFDRIRIDRAINNQAFEPVDVSYECRKKHQHWEEIDLSLLSAQTVQYRIVGITVAGQHLISPTLSFKVQAPPAEIDLQVTSIGSDNRIRIQYLSPGPCQLYVINLEGKIVEEIPLPAAPLGKRHDVPAFTSQTGLYVLYLENDTNFISKRVLLR